MFPGAVANKYKPYGPAASSHSYHWKASKKDQSVTHESFCKIMSCTVVSSATGSKRGEGKVFSQGSLPLLPGSCRNATLRFDIRHYKSLHLSHLFRNLSARHHHICCKEHSRGQNSVRFHLATQVLYCMPRRPGVDQDGGCELKSDSEHTKVQ